MEKYLVVFVCVGLLVAVVYGLFAPTSKIIDWCSEHDISSVKTLAIVFAYAWIYISLVWCGWKWLKYLAGRE